MERVADREEFSGPADYLVNAPSTVKEDEQEERKHPLRSGLGTQNSNPALVCRSYAKTLKNGIILFWLNARFSYLYSEKEASQGGINITIWLTRTDLLFNADDAK
jgi:hypothetical protein